LILIISILFILAAIAFYQYRTRATHWENTLASKQAELHQSQIAEENLRQELGVVQARLNCAIQDPLTRLLSWPLFEDRVKQNIEESARYQFSMAVLYVDINDFNMINEALGYEAGDVILNEVSQRLQTCIREMDNVSRLSKDIFVVMLTQLGKQETAAVVAHRILEALMQPISVKEQKVYITASIGISIYPTDGFDSAVLFRKADQALLLAKEKGHQHYHFYQQKNDTNSVRELELSTGLKQDSFLSECEIYYQPILNTSDKTIFCMQALLYWRHPVLGLIHSDELFSYMEKNDKSNTVSEWLIKNACQRFIAFRNVGFKPKFLGISLSIRQLKNNQFIYSISQILQECEFKPEWLLLQIEGSLAHIPFEAIEKSFNMLKYLNIRLAINHFGTSLFSIQDLQKLTVDYLMLDPSLIFDLQQSEKTIGLINAINLLAQSLSMQLIVQGVDTEKQMKILRGLGCDLIQGQCGGEPLPENEVIASL
jgi:diguanylate cyclase (GGDEF)-like protein